MRWVGQTTPFLPTFSIILIGLLPSSFLTSFLCLALPSFEDQSPAMAQPPTEMSPLCPYGYR